MTPLTTLYDEYIDRPKLIDQKPPFENITPRPLPLQKRSEQLVGKM